jgi:hypothetical protein
MYHPKDYLSQLDQVYYQRIFKNLQNITTSYKFIYKIYKHTILIKLSKCQAKVAWFISLGVK